MERPEPICGIGKRVQIDESKFGKRKYNRGRRVEGQNWFLGVLKQIEEEGSGRRTVIICK